MDAFLANPGPYAPTGALSHPIVSRVFAKLNESVPREKYIAFANCPAKQKPKRRFEHKRRKLTERNVEVGGAFNKSTRLAAKQNSKKNKASKQYPETTTIATSPREEVDVPGANLFLFRDRPEIMEAAETITNTNHHMSRQLNRLCQKRKILDHSYAKLLQRAAHFAEVEGKALLADRSSRDYAIEKLNKDLEQMNLKAYMGTHTTKSYIRLLRRSKKSARAVAREVVKKQAEVLLWTNPDGGHVARARNQVQVENIAWSLESKNVERTRNEFFEEIRADAARLSALRQNTTDQKLAIVLEEKAVKRREVIRKKALLDMAHDENKRLVSRALVTTSKRKMTKRGYLKLLTTLSKFQGLMNRLETSTGVVGIEAVVKRWFERDEREKSLRADQADSEEYISKCNVELKKMQNQLNQFQTFGTDTVYTKRAGREFEKLLSSFDVRTKKSQDKLRESSSQFQTKRLHLGLVAECLRSLCTRFKLENQAKSLSKQLDSMHGYTMQDENRLLAKRLIQCLSGLDRRICNMGRSILTGINVDDDESFVEAESKAKALEMVRLQQAATAKELEQKRVGKEEAYNALQITATITATSLSPTATKTSATKTPTHSPTTSTTTTTEEDELIYGLQKKSKLTLHKLKQESSKRDQKQSNSTTIQVQDLQLSGSMLSLLDLPCPLGANVRVPTRKERGLGDQGKTKGSGPMQRITQQLLDQVAFNGVKWAQVFQAIDMDGSGQIRRSEFGQVLRDLNIQVSQSDLELLMERFDDNRDDKLDYEEFLLMVGARDRDKDDKLQDSSDEDGNFADDLIEEKKKQEIENVKNKQKIEKEDIEIKKRIEEKEKKKKEERKQELNKEKDKEKDKAKDKGEETRDVETTSSTKTTTSAKEKSKDLSSKLAAAVAKEEQFNTTPTKNKRPSRRRNSSSRNMKQKIRDSEMNTKRLRKAKERKIKKQQKERELQDNIRSAVSAIKTGAVKVAAPSGFFRRSDRKKWSAEVASAGIRKRDRVPIEKEAKRVSLVERAKKDTKIKRREKEQEQKIKKEEEQKKAKELDDKAMDKVQLEDIHVVEKTKL